MSWQVEAPSASAAAFAALLASVSPMFPTTNVFTGASINCLGDSMTSAYVSYVQYNSPTYQAQLANNVPVWTTGVAYVVGNLVKTLQSGNYYVYRCIVAGTAGATAPTGITNSVSDGGATWISSLTLAVDTSFQHLLTWAEIFNDRLYFDMDLGYGGIDRSLLKVYVTNGGQNYSPSDTVAFNNGAAGTLIVGAGGVITGVTITNPGYDSAGYWTATVTTSTGSGATFSMVRGGSGTWSVPGCFTSDMVARLPDVVAAKPAICVVYGGGNDANSATSMSQVASITASAIANLKTCCETMMAAGIKVVIVPISVRAYNLTPQMRAIITRVNKWIKSYATQRSWANPSFYSSIAIADGNPFWNDRTQSTMYPRGGTGGVAYAVTVEGLHNSNSGAEINGYLVGLAAQKWTGAPQPYSTSTIYTADDGYDPIYNPSGNYLEGAPWIALTAYSLAQQVSANGNVYYCTQAGTTGNAGGPSGGGTAIADGTAKWGYAGPAKLSVLGSGSSGTLTAVAGVTSGSVATGLTLSRASGSATGSVVAAIENPYSNGQPGQRQTVAFSLGSGTATETWTLQLNYGAYGAYGLRNIQASDLGVTKFFALWEVELSNIAMLNKLYPYMANADADKFVYAGQSSSTGVGSELLPSAGDPLITSIGGYPNNGRMLLRTRPFIFPPNLVNFVMGLVVGFNASGAAASATATLKVNSVGFFKYGVA